MSNKIRLDLAVLEAGYAPSREKARAMIMAGEVLVNNHLADKPGMKIPTDAKIIVKSKPRFVSRGGQKLAQALQDFDLAVQEKTCADVGASTGGFTDCLLQHGAKHIYAIDVGYGQLAHTLRTDKRVTVLERTNARYLESLEEPVDLVVIDASFISLRLLLPVVQNWLNYPGDVIALIKPQFEAGKEKVGKGGVVKDTSIHAQVIQDISTFATDIGYDVSGLTPSPIKGPAGNIEFLIWLQWQQPQTESVDIRKLIENVLS